MNNQINRQLEHDIDPRIKTINKTLKKNTPSELTGVLFEIHDYLDLLDAISNPEFYADAPPETWSPK